MSDENRPPFPPFDLEAATLKVRKAEDAWNNKNPERIALAYSEDACWRNRAEFIEGREAIIAFLTRKWRRELDYRLVKELWAYEGNKIAVRFAYEFHDQNGQWFRSYGNENWAFNEQGMMIERIASINDLRIKEGERLLDWPSGPRPEPHPTLTALGL